MFPEAKPRETLRFGGDQNSRFPEEPVIKSFVIPPSSKEEKNRLRSRPAGSQICRGLKERDMIACDESSRCCYLRKLASLVWPRELASFVPRHLIRFPPIGKRIWVGRYNNRLCHARGAHAPVRHTALLRQEFSPPAHLLTSQVDVSFMVFPFGGAVSILLS